MYDFNNKVFLAFDLETTGLKPYSGDRIIEIAALPIYEKKIKYNYSYNTLVNPEVKIPGQISRIHKLNNTHISEAPTLTQIFPHFKNYVSDSILVSHNIEMDLKFLDIAAKESGLFPLRNYYIDTLELSRYFLEEKSYKLEYLSKKYNFHRGNYHRAWDDSIMTAKLFLKIVNLVTFKKIKSFLKKWEG